jgi:PAS domain S-box-containing protein
VKKDTAHYEALNAALQNHPDGISIQEVADLTGVHRNTAAKYLEVLQSQGEVDVRRIGVSKLFIASRRVPFTCIVRLYDDPVIGVDRDLLIVDLNKSAATLIGKDHPALLGSPIWNLEYLFGTGTTDRIREVIKGRWDRWDNGLRDPTLLIRGIPVKFSDSRTGAALLLVDQNEVLGIRAELDRCTDTLHMITDYQTEFIFRLTRDLIYTWVNPAYARLFNLMPDHMAGTRFALRIPDDERMHVIEAIQQAPPEGVTVEYRVHLPPGDIRHHQIIVYQQALKSGESGYICVGRDITDFKFKEEQFRRFYDGTEGILAERTRELRDLNRQLYLEIAGREQIESTLRSVEFAVQHVADLIIWFDPEGNVTYTNKAVHTLLKMGEDATGRSICSILEPPGGDWDLFWSSLRQHKSVFHETLLTATDEQRIPAEILFTHLKNGGDEYCCCIARDIHERKQAMAELIESENRFRQLAGTIPEVFFLRDIRTGSFLYINKAYEQIFGYPLSQIYQNPDSWIDQIHPDDHELVMKKLNEVDLPAWEAEFRIIRPDGAVRWVDVRVFPIVNSHDNPYRNVGVVFDTTERRLMEEELRLSNDRLMTTIRATPVSVFNQDTSLRYTWIGQSSIGLTPLDVIGKTDADIFVPEVAERLTKIKKGALVDGKGGHADVELDHLGRRWTVRMFFKPFRDTRGEISGLTIVVIDLTDLFMVKEALMSSEEKYRRLFEETNDICMVFSIIRDKAGHAVDFEYMDLNQRALTLMGREKREVIGRRLSDFRPDIDPRWFASLRQVADHGEHESFEGHSELFHRYVSVNAYPTGDGRIGVLARDISDLIRVHGQVEHQRDLGLALAATDDLQEALHLILEAGKKVPGIDSGGIYFIDDANRLVTLHSHIGLNQPYIDAVSSVPITPDMENAFNRSEPVYFRIDGVSKVPPSLDQLLKEGLKSYVALPILKDEKVYAILNLGSHTLHEIPICDRPYLESLTGYLGEALARLRRGLKNSGVSPLSPPSTFFQILDSDGRILDGSFQYGHEGFAHDMVRNLIHEGHASLLTGQEVSDFVKPDASHLMFRVRLRFMPWGRDVAYLVIWERSLPD